MPHYRQPRRLCTTQSKANATPVASGLSPQREATRPGSCPWPSRRSNAWPTGEAWRRPGDRRRSRGHDPDSPPLFHARLQELGLAGTLSQGELGVGVFFVPNEKGAYAELQEIVAQAAPREGLEVLGWREVPVRPEALGEHAAEDAPSYQPAL